MQTYNQTHSAKVIDCRSEVGITVGLIDGIISICRILSERDLSSDEIIEALKDLRSDKDVKSIMRKE